jgi:hypothetical protein
MRTAAASGSCFYFFAGRPISPPEYCAYGQFTQILLCIHPASSCQYITGHPVIITPYQELSAKQIKPRARWLLYFYFEL